MNDSRRHINVAALEGKMTNGKKIAIGLGVMGFVALAIFQLMIGVTIMEILYDIVGAFFGVNPSL